MQKIIEKILGDANMIKIKSILHFTRERQLKIKRRNFYMQFLNHGDIYYDIGANFGNRIVPIINEGLKIIAIEPQIKCTSFLKKRYKDKITVLPYGIGKENSFETMYISDLHTLSSFSEKWIDEMLKSGRFGKYKWNKQKKVEMKTLDSIIAKYGKPTFIKIDVEGYEYEVLLGLSEAAHVVSFEYAVPERENTIVNCINRFIEISNNYEVVFNYSIGESMEWALRDWLSYEEMKNEIKLSRFKDSQFGDIYVKTLTNK